MVVAAQTLSQLALLDQFKKSGKVEFDLKAWVANQEYYIDADITRTSFSLRIVNENFFRAISKDCDRFSMASIESLCAIQPNRVFARNSSWPIINAYYAGFFAAHALLRIFGVSFSQLSNSHVRKVWEFAKVVGRDNGVVSIEEGFYEGIFSKTDHTITFQKLKDSHADLWKCFLHLLQRLIDIVPSTSASTPDKLRTMELLAEIKSVISQHPGGSQGNWLSIIRNNVNYQGGYGAWFPYVNSCFDETKLAEIPRRLLTQNSSINKILDDNSELETSLNTALRIINLLITLLKVCNKKFNNESYNFKNGSLRMIH